MFNLKNPLARFLKTTKLSQRRPVRRPLNLEPLEGREVPANLVSTAFAAGTLTITGLDDLTTAGVQAGNNDQVVIVNGGAAGVVNLTLGGTSVFAPGSLAGFTGVKTIKLDMRLGNDVVTVNNVNITGDLTFLGGNGDDTLEIGGFTSNQSFGKVTVTNGDGNDSFTFHNGVSKVSGALTVNNGVGNSQVTLSDQAADELTVGSLSITNGDGFDALIVGGAKFTVNGATSIANGNGSSITKIAPTSKAQLSGAFTINNGEGFDQTILGFNDGLVAGALVLAKGVTI